MYNNNETREKILKKSRELFSVKGFKKTGIREIVKITGISIGTFYNYFKSKEELFLIVYLEENKKARESVKEDFIKMAEDDEDPIKIIKLLFYKFFDNAKNNPILKQFFNRELFDQIIEKLNPLDDEEYMDYFLGPLIPYIEKWREEGKIIDIKPQMIIGLFNSIAYVYSHKEHIGEELFPQLLDYLVEKVVEGLKP